MRKLILYTTFLFLSLSASAQLVMSPDSLSVQAPKDTTEFESKFQVTNNYASTVSFWWKLIRDDSFPDEWDFQICDANTCYFVGVDKCPKGNPNVMASGASNPNFSIKIKPKGVAATTLVYYKMYSDSDCTNEIASMPIMMEVGTNNLKLNLNSKELNVFPNPAVNKFMLSNSEGIDKLEIYNIAGKKMKEFDVAASKEYQVDDLRNGLYLVRFLDQKGKVVKVVRLSKR